MSPSESGLSCALRRTSTRATGPRCAVRSSARRARLASSRPAFAFFGRDSTGALLSVGTSDGGVRTGATPRGASTDGDSNVADVCAGKTRGLALGSRTFGDASTNRGGGAWGGAGFRGRGSGAAVRSRKAAAGPGSLVGAGGRTWYVSIRLGLCFSAGTPFSTKVAEMREAVAGSALFSPFPFHSVYSVEDHKKHVDWIKAINPKALVSVKVSTPTDVDMVAVGSYFAGAHIIHLDGSYGGTGAAPDIAKKNIAMPVEYAVPKVHKFLEGEDIREGITVIASGGVRNAYDAAKIIALGADGVCVGTADLVALECIRCHHCESGRGCARGIATTDTELTNLMDLEWGTQRIVNMYLAWGQQLRTILGRLGMKSITELTGRTDTLAHIDYMKKDEIRGELD